MDERELRELEQRVRDSVAGDLRAAVAALQGTVTAVYVAAAGDTRHKLTPFAQDTLRGHLIHTLEGLQRRNYRETRAALLGGARAALAGGAQDLDVAVSARLPHDIRGALRDLTAGMRQDLRDALQLARRGRLERYGDAQAVVALLRRAATRADRAAVWVVHRAHNEGIQRAIDRVWSQGVQVAMLWRAERDACITCLSYAGALAEPGEPFRPVVQVADPKAHLSAIAGPPAHPHCRCGLEPWFGPARDLDATDLPVVLRREAQRSIATGQAQGSEPARLRAADRLVELAGLLVPKTVLKRARKAVEAGTFER